MSTTKRTRRRTIGGMILWCVVAFVMLAIGILFLWGHKLVIRVERRNDAIMEVSPPEEASLVRVRRVQRRMLQDEIVLPGRVEADGGAQLAAEKNGRIVALPVDRGDRVKEGQVLLRIDGRHWEVARNRAAIELADAGRDLARWKKLKGKGAVAASEYDAIKKRHDLAAEAVKAADVHLSQCRIESPVTGVVDARYVDVGEYVTESQPVFKVVETNRLNVMVNVPEQDVSAVAVGAGLPMRCAALNDRVMTGRVAFVASDGDAASHTFTVELEVESPPDALKSGMIADVTLPRAIRERVVVVPLAAVVPKRGDHVVFVVENGRAVLRVVRIDSMLGENAVLASGLEDGDRLVVEGHRTLQDGIPVTVEETSATQE